MPTVRYQIKNEYGLADPALYGAADKEDPEALLEGVAMAGLVGVLRQLGDLAEYAAEIFHELHEEVMSTSSRGHGLLLRVQQLEAEFPATENDLFNQKEKSELNDSAGIDWHPNLQIDQNMVTREDMPRFILDCYEESRGPPRLFLLDKFDRAEDGACLKRYSDPSFFKTKFASTENMEANFHRERKSHKNKKKVLRLKNDINPKIQTPLLMENKLENLASEKVSESQQSNRLRLKRRQLNHNVNFGRSYVENILGPHISSNSLGDSHEKIKAISSIESSPPVREIIMDVPNVRQVFKEKSSPESLIKKVETPLPTQKTDNKEVPEEESGEVEKSLPSFPVNDLYKREVSGSAQSKSSSSLNDYRTDDVASELENYLDALATMESEIETDNEARTKLVQSTYIKEYPNSSLNESKIYSGEFSIHANEKPPQKFAESLPSGCSSEMPPFTIMNQDIAADEFIETDLVNKLIMSKTLENEFSIVLVQDQVIESAGADPDALPNGIKRGETTDVSDHGIKLLVSSEIHELETNVMSTDGAEEHKLNEKIVDDDHSLRSGDPNIDVFDSPGDRSGLKLQTHDGPQETLNEDPEDDKDLLLTFPNTENPEERQGSISQASSKKSAPLTPVDDRSSTGSTEGLFEAKESYFSSSERFEQARSSTCSEVAGDSSGNDDLSAENSRNFTESETTVSGVLSQDSFVSNHVKSTPNESSEEQKPQDTACILESSSVSNSGYYDLAFQAGPLEIAEEKLRPNNGGKPTLSLNPFLQSESDSMLSDGQNQIDMSVSKILMGGNDQQLSESRICQWQTNQADDDVVHKPINQMDDKLWSDASLQDLETEERFLRSSETSNFDSTRGDEVHEPIDQMDKKLPIIVSSHDLKIKDKFLRSSGTSDFDSSKDDEVHEPIDQMDKKLSISVPSQDLQTEERPQSSEISNFDSTKDDTVHEPIDQIYKKLSIIVSSQDLEAEGLQSSEISNFDSTNNDAVRGPIDRTDKKLLTIVSPQVLETEERFLQSSETSNFDSTKDVEVYNPIDQIDKQHLTIASPLDLETEERLLRSSETSSFESIKVDNNNARNLEVNEADSSPLASQFAPSLSAVLLSREELEAEAGFLPKQVSTFLSVHETSEISLQEKSEKEDKTLERAGSAILSTESTRDLLQGTGSIKTQDSERILSNTEVQYTRQPGIEILESSKIPNTFLPLDNKEIHVLDEDPPPPPLPPIQWRMGKFRPNSIPSIRGIKSTPSPSADHFCSSPLMWEPQLLPSNSFQDTQLASFAPSQEHQKIEVRQDALIKETFESDANYMHQLPITISHPKTSSILVSMSPEPSNPFLSPASTESERMPRDRIIDGYFSDALLSTEAVPQGLLSYQGFYMYASEDEPFTREEYQKPIRRPSSLLNRPRDPLIEAVASHDKSTLRRVSELARTSPKSEGERNNPLLEQIRNKSFNLKPAAVTKPIMKAPPTNLKVAAILEKANAIRQAVAGSDEDEDGDSWSDS